MKRIALVLLLAAGLVAMSAGPAAACSCVAASPKGFARAADVAFTGDVVGETLPGVWPNATIFEVTTAYKEVEPGEQVHVFHGSQGASCGVQFAAGDTYTIFAKNFRKRLKTSLCSGNRRGAIDAEEYGFQVVNSPLETSDAGTREAEGLNTWTIVLPVALLLGLGTGLGLALIHRRRRIGDAPNP